jgi:hypothetical protein
LWINPKYQKTINKIIKSYINLRDVLFYERRIREEEERSSRQTRK